MHFRKSLYIIFLLAWGCSIHLNEPAHTPGVVDLGGDAGCLAGASQTVFAYFQGKADADEINGLFNCSIKSIQLFQEKTHGAETGKYNGFELRDFIQTYFLKKPFSSAGNESGGILTDGLVSNFMLLKQSILGGEKDGFTYAELTKLKTILETLKTSALELREFMPLTTIKISEWDEERLKNATVKLENFGKSFEELLKCNVTSYSLKNFKEFLSEIDQFNAGRTDFNGYYVKYNSFLKVFKSFFLGSTDTDNLNCDWSKIVKFGTGWYSLYLKSTYFNKVFSEWSYGHGHIYLVQILNDGLSLLREAVLQHPNQVIEFKEIDQLIDLIPIEIATKLGSNDPNKFYPIIKKLIEKIIVRALNLEKPEYFPEKPITSDLPVEKPTKTKGLNLKAIDYIQSIVNDWTTGQHLLEELFSKLTSFQTNNNKKVSTKCLLYQMQIESKKSNYSDREKGILNELKILVKDWPAFHDEEHPDEISFVGHGNERFHSLRTLSKMNWSFRLIQLILRGYGKEDVNLLGGFGLLGSDLKEFENDYRKFFSVVLKKLNPRRRNLYKYRFAEGDLFTYASFGDQVLSAEEATLLFSFLVSTKSLGDRLHEQIGSICSKKSGNSYQIEKDVLGGLLIEKSYYTEVGVLRKAGSASLPEEDLLGGLFIEEGCYWREFYQIILSTYNKSPHEKILKNLPLLDAFINNLFFKDLKFHTSAQDQLTSLLQQFIQLTAITPKDIPEDERINPVMIHPGYIDTADTETVIGVLQYVEALLDRLDRKSQDYIDREDAELAYPLFRTLIKTISKIEDEETLRSIYFYLLNEGAFPSSGWKGWLSLKAEGNTVKSDRMKLLKIFLEVIKQIKAQKD